MKKLNGTYMLESDYRLASRALGTEASSLSEVNCDWPAPAFPSFVTYKKDQKVTPAFRLQFRITTGTGTGSWCITQVNADGSNGEVLAVTRVVNSGAIPNGATAWQVGGAQQVQVAITKRRDFAEKKDQAELKPLLQDISGQQKALKQLGARRTCDQLVKEAHDPPNLDVTRSIEANSKRLIPKNAWDRVVSTTHGEGATPEDIAKEKPCASLNTQALHEFSGQLESAMRDIETRGKMFTQEQRWKAAVQAAQDAISRMHSDWSLGFGSLNDLCKRIMLGLTVTALKNFLLPSTDLQGTRVQNMGVILHHSKAVKDAALRVNELRELNESQHCPEENPERFTELLAKHGFTGVDDVPQTILMDIKQASDALLERQEQLTHSLAAATATSKEAVEHITSSLFDTLEQCLHEGVAASKATSDRYTATSTKIGVTVQAIRCEIVDCDSAYQAQVNTRRDQVSAYEQGVRQREMEQKEDNDIIRKALARTLEREQKHRAATSEDQKLEEQHQVKTGVVTANKAVWQACKEDIEKYKEVCDESSKEARQAGTLCAKLIGTMQHNAQHDATRLKQQALGFGTQQLTNHCKAYTLVLSEKLQKEFDIQDCKELVARNGAQIKKSARMGGSFNHERIQTLRVETADTKEKMEQYTQDKTSLTAKMAEIEQQGRPVVALLGDLCMPPGRLADRASFVARPKDCDEATRQVLDSQDSQLVDELRTCVKKLPPIQPKAELEEQYTKYLKWLHGVSEEELAAAERQAELDRERFMQNIGLLRLENDPADDAPELAVAAEPAVLKSSPEDRFCSVVFAEQVDAELLAAGAPPCKTAPVAEAVPPPSKGRRSDGGSSPRPTEGSGGGGGGGWGISAGLGDLVSKAKAAASGA